LFVSAVVEQVEGQLVHRQAEAGEVVEAEKL
jgi:hypothetical protein